jgi:hypothetical protein
LVKRANLARYRVLFGFLVNGALVLLFGVLLYQNRESLPLVTQLLTPSIIGACLLFYFASYMIQFLIWKGMMGYQRGERSRGLDEYIRTIFMGWLPGGLWKIFGRMTIYRAPRLSRNMILLINLLEMFLLLLANASVLLLLSPFALWTKGMGMGILLVILIVAAVRFSHLLPTISGVNTTVRWLSWGGGYMLAWLCGGMITYLVVSPFASSIMLTDAIRFWCLAGAAGLVLQALPINTLVRDATMAAMLAQTIGLHTAIIAAFAVRLMMLACEMLVGWALLVVIGLYRMAFRSGDTPVS